jgi:putative hydrolase of HD superfamily
MFGKHLRDTRRCMNVKRYGTEFCFMSRSDSEHMWSVAKICEGLALWEITKFNNNVDMGYLLQKAINHDVMEAFTGDICGPVKALSKSFKANLEEIEKGFYNSIIAPVLPKSWRAYFEKLILNPKTKDIEGQILSAADIIDTLFEAIDEISVGNKSFEKILYENSKKLIQFDLESVHYFIKYAFNDWDIDFNLFSDEFNKFRDSLDYDATVFENGWPF